MMRPVTATLLSTIALATAPFAHADTFPPIQGITFVKPLKIASRVGNLQNALVTKRDFGEHSSCGLRVSRDKEIQREYALPKGAHLTLIKDPAAEKSQTRPQGPIWMWGIELEDKKGLVLALRCTGMGDVPFKDVQKAFADLLTLDTAK